MGYFQIPNGSQRSTKRYSFFIAYTPSSNHAEKPTMRQSPNNRKATDFFTHSAGILSRHVSKKIIKHNAVQPSTLSA